jgi:hypothetical protein
MSNLLKTSTCFLIFGKDIDAELITEKLNFSPTAVTRQSDTVLPSLANGGGRDYDPRWNLDCWKRHLTGKQYQFALDKQLEFWLEKLYPVKSAFEELKKMGYWSVIDCQITTDDAQLPCIQFRLTNKLMLKLSQISIDLDFTIIRATANPQMYLFTDDGNKVAFYDKEGIKIHNSEYPPI